MSQQVRQRAQSARVAARALATTSEEVRNQALEAIAAAIEANRERILAANAEDLSAAEQTGLPMPLLKRLDLRGSKFSGVVEMVDSVAAQPDPLGQTLRATELQEHLHLYRVSVPIGVIGVVFESRPDALVQIAALCLKSGNAVLLKGGREASATNRSLATVMQQAAAGIEGVPDDWMTLLEGREEVRELLDQEGLVDLIIPRGSNDFVQYIMHHTRIPVMGHTEGICHVYVDESADLDKALPIAVDSKTGNVAACNAAETLLVHAAIAKRFMAVAIEQLAARGVLIRGDARTLALAESLGAVTPASDIDWSTEYLDYILSIKIVDSVTEAIAHVNEYGSHHTDTIVAESRSAARAFLRGVDSASVMHNASTRFADGFRYGLGAEVGVSTNRIHSRGPVGLDGLVIYKYVLEGDGHIVDGYDGYQGAGPLPFTHRALDEQCRV